MTEITFKGNPIHTVGQLPERGSKAPDFSLTGMDLQDVSLANFAGKRLLLNIFPSVDTGVCAASVRRFHLEAAQIDNVVIANISADLPFAHKRFCGAEGIENAISLSEMRQHQFGEAYGVRMSDGPLAGLLSRAIVIVDEKGQVIYTEQVPEIAQEPDYEKALAALKA